MDAIQGYTAPLPPSQRRAHLLEASHRLGAAADHLFRQLKDVDVVHVRLRRSDLKARIKRHTPNPRGCCCRCLATSTRLIMDAGRAALRRCWIGAAAARGLTKQ